MNKKHLIIILLLFIAFGFGIFCGMCYGKYNTLNNAIVRNDEEMGKGHFIIELPHDEKYYYYYE